MAPLTPNLLAALVAALSSLAIGFIWYNPKVFGNAWMRSIGKTQDDMKSGSMNMGLLMFLTFLFAFIAALGLQTVVIHQYGIFSLIQNKPAYMICNLSHEEWAKQSYDALKDNFRTFGHGALHGVLAGIFLALPVIGTSAIYEQRKFKYIAISTGYWIVCFAIMGGIICAWK